ncbi:putative toxin-antitoxin system toxin component, PIN family [Massilia sp. TS11]|uniref:putative toxin-antitoxin system toxin component, PIN family n=1 Tax=Massilia sp. TS11 TaxID=2908003 RepID=UPI001EDBCFF6|nr:putative toxin-antitoxin system toxin component, PIN family [Massilia sp. TS11]MCG2584564.1 putative toxin-antitoxin system toxin component, PIN family [Massilia sp. TS11]
MIPRLILDTNVCLDLFVWQDPRVASLRAALAAGLVEAVTNPACRKEFRFVLHYPHLPLDAETRPRAAAAFDAAITLIEPPARPLLLPVCTDREDQKFLELARDAGADVLISKDKALLKLNKRTAAARLFRIVTPEDWVGAFALECADAHSALPS